MKKYMIFYIVLILLIEYALINATFMEKSMSLTSFIIISLILLVSVVFSVKNNIEPGEA